MFQGVDVAGVAAAEPGTIIDWYRRCAETGPQAEAPASLLFTLYSPQSVVLQQPSGHVSGRVNHVVPTEYSVNIQHVS